MVCESMGVFVDVVLRHLTETCGIRADILYNHFTYYFLHTFLTGEWS